MAGQGCPNMGGIIMTRACCAFHGKEFLYICKCKKLFPDNEEWWNHAWQEHYGDTSGWIKVPSKFYAHGDRPQMVVRKVLLQNINIYA